MEVRPRVDADIVACEQLGREVHELDGYPPYLPDGGLTGFLVSPVALGAWVAEIDTEIVGHVALHPRTAQVAMDMVARFVGEPQERLAVVARLLVGPRFRRSGIGRALLTAAVNGAVALDRRAMLDVVTQFRSAIDLYESCGWVQVGRITAHVPGKGALEELVYVAPC